MRHATLRALLALAVSAGAALSVPAPPALAAPTHGDSVPPLSPARLASPVVIDGALDDAAWQAPPTLKSFTQAGAFEGQVPRESTWVWLAYDEDAIVVAARCWDAHPESMVVRMVRRDTDTAVDYFEILLDPFHDHRSGYYFAISAAACSTMPSASTMAGGTTAGTACGRGAAGARGLYLVWTQSRADFEPLGELRFGPSTRRLLGARADDIFMVKATYYLNL